LTPTNTNTIQLKKGQYLAPKYLIANFDDLLIGITNYERPVETGVWHSHEKPMISYVLYGHNMEYRKGKRIERVPGSANYYHSNEIHKNIYKHFPSKHISLELDFDFLRNYSYTETEVADAVAKSEDAVFTFVKLMHETQMNDAQSKNAIEMLFLAFMENALKLHVETQLPPWIKSVRDLLNDRWMENVSLIELSENADVHPTSISRYFRKYFQCTLGEWTSYFLPIIPLPKRHICVGFPTKVISPGSLSYTRVIFPKNILKSNNANFILFYLDWISFL